jgi:hypothetical protein
LIFIGFYGFTIDGLQVIQAFCVFSIYLFDGIQAFFVFIVIYQDHILYYEITAAMLMIYTAQSVPR